MALAGGFAVVAVMILMVADALGRKLGWPVPGAVEFSEAAMVPAVFLPLMYVQMRRDNVFVSVVTRRLSPQIQALLDALGALVGIAIFGLLTWLAVGKAWEAWVAQEYRVAVIAVPVWPFRWLIALGTGLLCLQLASTTLEELRNAFRRVA